MRSKKILKYIHFWNPQTIWKCCLNSKEKAQLNWELTRSLTWDWHCCCKSDWYSNQVSCLVILYFLKKSLNFNQFHTKFISRTPAFQWYLFYYKIKDWFYLTKQKVWLKALSEWYWHKGSILIYQKSN